GAGGGARLTGGARGGGGGGGSPGWVGRGRVRGGREAGGPDSAPRPPRHPQRPHPARQGRARAHAHSTRRSVRGATPPTARLPPFPAHPLLVPSIRYSATGSICTVTWLMS